MATGTSHCQGEALVLVNDPVIALETLYYVTENLVMLGRMSSLAIVSILELCAVVRLYLLELKQMNVPKDGRLFAA